MRNDWHDSDVFMTEVGIRIPVEVERKAVAPAKSDFRNAAFCVAISMAALLLAWPFANIGFDDDWTWAFTVLRLSQTGHLTYNGWSSPSVISQAYWGLLDPTKAATRPMVSGSSG